MRRIAMTWFLFASLGLTAADWFGSWLGEGSKPAGNETGEVRAQEGGNGLPPPCCP